jgi:lysophospholipase L1-like esterase
MHSILPTNDNVKNEYPAAYNKNNIVNSVNSQIQKLSAKYNVVYIDINKIFRDKYGKLNLKYASYDGLHLNDFGYKIWIQLLKKNKYL